MTEAQLQTLIAALRQPVQGPPQQMDGGPNMAAGAAALVGQMPPCHLEKDKIKRFKKWKDWLGDDENTMAFLGISTDQQKVNFFRCCGGSELTEFWEKEAHIRFTAVLADPDRGIAALDVHKYNEIIDESKKSMLTLISRDRAIIDLLRIEQGNRSFMDFLAVMEDQEYLCRTDEDWITGDDLKRISLIAGMKDRTLAEKAIAEEYNHQQVIQAGVNSESSRANVEAMQARPTSTISHLDDTDTHADNLDAKICYLQEELDAVRRFRKHGKYSSRYKPDRKTGMGAACHKCTYKHSEGRCPADGRRCNACGQEGHFQRSMLCKARSSRTKLRTARHVDDEETPTPSEDSEDKYEPVARIQTKHASRCWPGVAKGTTATNAIHFVQRTGHKNSKLVKLIIGGVQVQLYCDMGSRLTIIPPEM